MEPTTLVLMGRTGNGKSSTGNSVVGGNAFKVGLSFASVTKECQLEKTTLKDGRIINVIDTPGLFDTNSTNSKEFIPSQIMKCIELAKNVVHGVLYVISVNNRFTAEEANVLDSLELLFGPRIIDYMVIVFTGGDELENNGMTLEDYLKDSTPQLEEVLRRCNMRKVLFNNKATTQSKKETQTAELMKEIENIIAQNGGRPYSYDLLCQAQENTEKLVGRERCHTRALRSCHDGELDKHNAEHTKKSNPTVNETMLEKAKIYDDKGTEGDDILRKKLEQEANELIKKIEKMSERNPMQEFRKKAFEACEALSRTGCTIL